jgi:hypothetical protein
MLILGMLLFSCLLLCVGALLDTGSTVSTISESYYQQHIACSIQLKTIKELLDIECAGGSQLPYSGYIMTIIFKVELV